MVVECSYAKKYKAKRPPSCGCLACRLKWLEKRNEELEEKIKYLESRVRSSKQSADTALLVSQYF